MYPCTYTAVTVTDPLFPFSKPFPKSVAPRRHRLRGRPSGTNCCPEIGLSNESDLYSLASEVIELQRFQNPTKGLLAVPDTIAEHPAARTTNSATVSDHVTPAGRCGGSLSHAEGLHVLSKWVNPKPNSGGIAGTGSAPFRVSLPPLRCSWGTLR